MGQQEPVWLFLLGDESEKEERDGAMAVRELFLGGFNGTWVEVKARECVACLRFWFGNHCSVEDLCFLLLVLFPFHQSRAFSQVLLPE